MKIQVKIIILNIGQEQLYDYKGYFNLFYIQQQGITAQWTSSSARVVECWVGGFGVNPLAWWSLWADFVLGSISWDGEVSLGYNGMATASSWVPECFEIHVGGFGFEIHVGGFGVNPLGWRSLGVNPSGWQGLGYNGKVLGTTGWLPLLYVWLNIST